MGRFVSAIRSPNLAFALSVIGLTSLGCFVVVPCHRFPDHELGEDENICICDGIGECALTCDPGLPCEVGCGQSVEFAAVDCTGNPFCDTTCIGAEVVTLDCTDAEFCALRCQDDQVCVVDCAGAAECGADCQFGGNCEVRNCEAGVCILQCPEETIEGVEGGGTVSCD